MKRGLVLLAMLFLLLLVACSQKDEVSNKDVDDTTDEPVQEEIVEEEPLEPSYLYPLTGEKTDEVVTDRPFAVMINNHPQARPQSGIHMADIVYEILAEGDVTRFLAVFQSEKPDVIGPVRSARDYFIELSTGFDALYVAHGWSPEAKEILNNGSVDNLNGIVYDGSLFWRANHNVAPHNSYTSFENIVKGANQKNYSMEKEISGFTFLTEDEVSLIDGIPAENVRVAYSSRETFTSVYKFNKEYNQYERYSNGKQTVDRESETPVLLDNVLIVEMNHQFIDDYGRREVDLSSGGKGLLLQMGKAKEVEWKNIDGKIVPFSNGKEVAFVPGKTWVNIIPTARGIDSSVSFGE